MRREWWCRTYRDDYRGDVQRVDDAQQADQALASQREFEPEESCKSELDSEGIDACDAAPAIRLAV